MFRYIKPDNGYCLFFPSRTKGQRFVAGRRVRVGWFEDYKHIKLGQFEVRLPLEGHQDLTTTVENLQCAVEADFKIVVGGREEGREDRLERATISCPPGRRLAARIELPFFQAWSANYCRNSIARILGMRSFIPLLTDEDYRAETVRLIVHDLETNLDGIGLILVEHAIVIEPLEPKGGAIPAGILNSWLTYKTRIREIVDEAELSDQRATQQKEQSKGRMKQETTIENKRLASDLEEQDRQFKILAQERERQKEATIREIQKQMADWAKETGLDMLRNDAELEEAAELKKERIAALKRAHEDQEMQHKLHLLDVEHAVKEKELNSIKITETVSTTQLELERKREELRTEMLERQQLGAAAAEIRLREILMEALPRMMFEANRPLEKMGEIRSISVVGGLGAGSQPDGGAVGGLLAQASMLPLIREIFTFVTDIESGGHRNDPPRGPSSTGGTTGNGRPGRPLSDRTTD